MKIGFKNFRKFVDFPPIELSPITFIVGPNNSGKSSFIKALTLLLVNLRERANFIKEVDGNVKMPLQYISFWNKSNSNYGWGDYNTCLNYDSGENDIIFKIGFSDPIPESEKTNVGVCHVLTKESSNGNEPKFDEEEKFFEKPEEDIITIKIGFNKKGSSFGQADLLTVPVKEFKYESEDISINYNVSLLTGKVDEKYRISISYLKKYIKERETPVSDKPYVLSNKEILNEGIITEIKKVIEIFVKEHPEAKEIQIKRLEGESLERLTSIIIACCQAKLYDILVPKKNNNFVHRTLFPHIWYLETHNATHQIAIPTSDRSNYLGQTLIEYVSEVTQKIKSYKEAVKIKDWICKWLKNFKIGEDFNIIIRDGGENAIVKIYTNSQKDGVMLGSLGTGSIQMFILLLKIGIALKKAPQYYESPILMLIEEPEQNLHPALQSLLADLFKEVVEISEGRIQFVIETHSEYLIRRTQVMVAKDNYPSEEDLQKNNLFRVYYFPQEGLPYDMKYMVNGRFSEKFGSGFFDESAKWHLEILKREKESK